MTNPAQRSQSIDIAKGLGIILVMLGHLKMPELLINLIYFFHMPLFIFLSGALAKEKTLLDEISGSIWMLSTVLFYGVVFIAVASLRNGSINVSHLQSLAAMRPDDMYSIPFFGVFWFLSALAVVRVISRALGRFWPCAAIPAFFLANYFNLKYPESISNLPLCIGPALLLLIFYRLGTYFMLIEQKINLRIFLFTIFFYMTLTLVVFEKYGIDRKLANYHQMVLPNPIIAIILGFFGILAAVGFSSGLSRTKLYGSPIAWIGKNSFHYFAWHLLAFYIAGRLSLYLEISQNFSLAFQFLGGLMFGSASAFLADRYSGKIPTTLRRVVLVR